MWTNNLQGTLSLTENGYDMDFKLLNSYGPLNFSLGLLILALPDFGTIQW